MVTPMVGSAWSDDASDVPFVGREGELAALRELVARPEVEVVELVGEPGVGKSRLARQLIHLLGPDADVALVDDVMTSGATLAAAAHALKAAGAARVTNLVALRTARD